MDHKKEMEIKELDLDQLGQVTAGAMMTMEEIQNIAINTCWTCEQADGGCWGYVKQLQMQFAADPNLKKVEVHCPKGVLNI